MRRFINGGNVPYNSRIYSVRIIGVGHVNGVAASDLTQGAVYAVIEGLEGVNGGQRVQISPTNVDVTPDGAGTYNVVTVVNTVVTFERVPVYSSGLFVTGTVQKAFPLLVEYEPVEEIECHPTSC
jgi:hypothetical protein